jgi:5'-phosphate synthase pdxT subunit
VARIGVLALQGDFREHIRILRRLGAESNEVRLPQHLAGLDGLILPGGESTTIGKLMVEYQLLGPLRDLAANGLPMWGTCAGLILLARDAGCEQPLIGALDVTVQRNAFGRQVDSFEADLMVPALTEPQSPFRAVFIRAPLVTRVGPDVEVLARLGSTDESSRTEADHPIIRSSSTTIVAVRQGRLLGMAFHPELTDDDRFHRYFLTLIGR